MIFDEKEVLVGQRDRAVKALEGIMARIEEGTLCRDTSKDHLATWPLRMLELVSNLQAAKSVLKEYEKPIRQTR